MDGRPVTVEINFAFSNFSGVVWTGRNFKTFAILSCSVCFPRNNTDLCQNDCQDFFNRGKRKF